MIEGIFLFGIVLPSIKSIYDIASGKTLEVHICHFVFMTFVLLLSFLLTKFFGIIGYFIVIFITIAFSFIEGSIIINRTKRMFTQYIKFTFRSLLETIGMIETAAKNVYSKIIEMLI